MIDLTIKTLDSQNRAFTVPEDYTVRQLKEHIAEAVSIAPDVQRLIYCGRVLVDEHKISQYNVHGKVIHLVERAPPSTSRGDPDGGSTTGDQGTTGGGFGNLPRFHIVGGGGPRGRRGRGQDNTMYLGAMAFPADLMDARGISMPQPRPCLTRSRLLVARSMLNTASRTLARLENPRSASSERTTTTAEPSSSQESVVESPTPTPDVTSRRNSTSDTQSEDNDESNLELATQAATAAALVSAVLDEAVAQNTNNQQEETIDITIEEVETSGGNTGVGASSGLPEDLSMMEDAESPISPIVLSPSCPEPPRDQESSPPPSMETEPGTSSTPPQPPPTNNTSTQPAGDTSSSSSAQHQRGLPARPQCMSTIIRQLNELNQRLEPFMNQYYNLLQADPNYESNQQGTTNGESTSTSDVHSPSSGTTSATNSEGQTAPAPTSTAENSGDYPRTAAEADLLFRSISEIMHALSHSYHALSDIVCSFSRQPGQGRVLRCRPVLIQHSAVLHAPVPVLVERAAQSISMDRLRQGAQQQQQSATGGVSSSTASSNTTDQQSTGPVPAAAASVNNGGAGARFQISPNNLDIFMEMGPTITIDSVEATILQRNDPTANPTTGHTNAGPNPTAGPTATGTTGNDTSTAPRPTTTTGTPASGTGQFPWGTPPPPEFIQNLPTVTPPEFIQNLVQSISERIGDVGEANIHIAFPGTGGTLIASTLPPAPPQPGQQQAGSATATTGSTSPTGGVRAPESTQARVNTQTHPTTSTQTRSTSRPQIHLARTIQNHLRTFDPFLPCNSHHIRNRRNGSTRSGSNNTSQWQSVNNNNNNNNNGATANTGPTNVRSTPSGVTAEFNMPATAPFANIVESILSHSLENMSQGGAGGLGPNIVALGPGATFGPGGTANISFEIGRVTPLTVNSAGLASMMGAAANAAAAATANVAAAAGQNVNSAAAPPRPEGSNMDSPQSPPLPQQGLPPGGGGFLASLFGQLGNLLTHGGNSDLQGGMRNAGGTTNNTPGGNQSSGAGEGGARPWVEIASSGGGAIGSPDFISFLQNMAAQNPNINMPFYQPQQPAPSAPPAPSVSPLLPLVRRLLLDQQDLVSNHMNSSLAQFLGLTLREPLSSSPEFLPDLLFTVLSTVTLEDILSSPSSSSNNPPAVDHSIFNQFIERWFGPGGIGSRFQPSHYLDMLEVETEIYFSTMPNVLSRLVDNIDLTRSLSRLNVDLMEPFIRLMGNTSGPLFRSRFLESLKAYFQNLLSLLIRCFNDSTFVSTLLRTIVQREIAECQPSGDSSASFSSSHPQRVSLLIQMIPNLVQLVSSQQYRPVSWYLAYRNPPHPRPPRAGTTPQVSTNPTPRGGEPMDIEAAADASLSAPVPVNSRPDDPLPDNIIIGSESWHNTIPSDWVPIITRDSQRQRREPNQGPFSDAYLAGMPTKRRKIVTSQKPAANNLISDTMKSALSAAGVSTSSDAIATSAAADPQLRAAYREQVRAQVRESLQSCPDYTNERYPNSTKFFDSKKKQ